MGTRRSGRGKRWWLAMALLPALAGCANSRVAPPPDATRIDARHDPELLVAACTSSGLTLSSQIVSASAAGLRISVSSTGPAGTYMNLSWDGGGEGNLAPRTPTVWTLPAPPGFVQITCSTPIHEWPAQTVTVTDPQHQWSQTTMSDLACPPGISPGWTTTESGHGATAEDAVRDMLRIMKRTDWSHATQTRAPVGYPESPVQTWIVAVSDRPELSATVTKAGASFEASPGTICHT